MDSERIVCSLCRKRRNEQARFLNILGVGKRANDAPVERSIGPPVASSRCIFGDALPSVSRGLTDITDVKELDCGVLAQESLPKGQLRRRAGLRRQEPGVCRNVRLACFVDDVEPYSLPIAWLTSVCSFAGLGSLTCR